MRIITTCLLVMLAACSCNKDKDVGPKQIDVIYEIETEVSSFMEVKISEHYDNANPPAGGMTFWNFSGTGKFEKAVKIQSGYGAFFHALHATSDKWKIRIKLKNGTVLSESTSINYFRGPPSYYYASIQAEIK